MSDDSEPKPDFWTRPIFRVENLQASIDRLLSRKLGLELNWRSGDDAAELNRSGIELILYASGGRARCHSERDNRRAHEHIKLDKLHNELVRTPPWYADRPAKPAGKTATRTSSRSKT